MRVPLKTGTSSALAAALLMGRKPTMDGATGKVRAPLIVLRVSVRAKSGSSNGNPDRDRQRSPHGQAPCWYAECGCSRRNNATTQALPRQLAGPDYNRVRL
jgi:hypothetical protein